MNEKTAFALCMTVLWAIVFVQAMGDLAIGICMGVLFGIGFGLFGIEGESDGKR